MKLSKRLKKRSKFIEKLEHDDMRFLQKKITGKSVYKTVSDLYKRKPKHQSTLQQFQY